MNLIETIALTKTYAYDENKYDRGIYNISLQVAKGEFIALQGHSGSGKTTLLNLLGCIDVATSGTYLFNQQPMTNYSAKQFAQFRLKNIGLVFQSYHLLRNRNIVDNVGLPLLYAGFSKPEAKERAMALIQSVGLGNLEHKIVRNLSGGQQQRVAIARAIINSPQLILADEPTGNLDKKNSFIIYDLLKAINEEKHTTIIVATHDLEINKYAHRIVHISEGEIIL